MSKRFDGTPPILEVIWRDTKLDNGGWETIEDHLRGRHALPSYSVGFVLTDDEEGISLASSIYGDNAAGVVHIPASQVVKRRRLR